MDEKEKDILKEKIIFNISENNIREGKWEAWNVVKTSVIDAIDEI